MRHSIYSSACLLTCLFTAAVHGQGPTASALGFFEQTWRSLAILLGTPAGAAAAPASARHGLTARHADLGGFIDPDGARFLSQTPHTTVVTP